MSPLAGPPDFSSVQAAAAGSEIPEILSGLMYGFTELHSERGCESMPYNSQIQHSLTSRSDLTGARGGKGFF